MATLHHSLVFLLAIFYAAPSNPQKINIQELKCLVCQKTVDEMEKEIEKVDPGKKVDVGTYRLDHKGNQAQRKVELRRSEVFLTDLMETVCNKMDDYVRVRSKTSGKLMVIPLIINGAMNPDLGGYDIIQDGDLNKSLKFYCENLVEEFEDGIIKAFSSESAKDLDIRICSEHAKLCNMNLTEDYEFEANDEL
ncbi:TLR4 regulator and MIR-interacting MSAP [Nesidiocoris tenuis]|uniref:TLR4 regulator and MIR-interacting MSAP n=1 Tax=Nesidiocoris tenuis TaxID=355587 RepID=A0ABN7ASZ4_9HEMI|nr:TLR4 regulator and MIR-interacting MSAP [Nesidiocoris tenuis]